MSSYQSTAKVVCAFGHCHFQSSGAVSDTQLLHQHALLALHVFESQAHTVGCDGFYDRDLLGTYKAKSLFCTW